MQMINTSNFVKTMDFNFVQHAIKISTSLDYSTLLECFLPIFNNVNLTTSLLNSVMVFNITDIDNLIMPI